MASIPYVQDKKEAPALQVLLFWIPGDLNMLGRNEFALRQGFACGKTLVRRKSAAPLCGAPVLTGIYALRTRQNRQAPTGRCML